MEEYDLGRDISDAAMQRGISPVEMRAQLLQTMLQDDGKTISDKDRDLYAMGEIGLAEAVKRSTVDRTLRTDVKALTERIQKGIAGLRPKIEDFSEYLSGDPSYRGAEAGMGRTLSDLDQVQALAAESGRTISSRDVLNMLQEGRTLSDQDLSGRTLSNQDLAIGRTMSDQDQQNEFLPRRVAGFRNHLQDVLARSGATISDADREFLQRLIASPVDPNTLSDRDQRILSDIKLGRTPSDQDLGGGGRTLSDSDAAILEMLK
jgi:antitoxin component of RelBE/YafQ-DinJ toxin-antitoxin module